MHGERLERLEQAVESLADHARAIELTKRIEALERRSTEVGQHGKRKSDKDFWDRLQASSAVILGIAGLVITGWLSHILDVRRLEIAQGAAMRELLETLRSEDVTRDKAIAAGFSLAAHGRGAIVPLIHQLQSRDAIQRHAAEVGLRALGLTQRYRTCDELSNVLRNRTRLLSWQTHRIAIRLAGVIGCRGALSTLEDYGELVGVTEKAVEPESPAPRSDLSSILGDDCPRDEEILAAYRSVVAESPSPRWDNICELREEIKGSMAVIEREERVWRLSWD